MHRKIFAAIAAAAALAACSTKESNTADSAAVADSAAAAATAAAPNEVTITASEYAFAAPDQIPAGWTKFNLVDSGKQPHHATLFKLTGGKTFQDAADSLKVMKPGAPPPSWVVPLGGPNAVDPGGSGNAIVNLEAGNYMLICFLPDPTGAPHFTHGMMKGLTVTPATNTAGAAPAADITVTMTDYKFDWSKPLTAGTHTIEVKTAANAQPHEIQVFRLAPGKSQKDLTDWLGAMIQGKLTANTPPPASLIGGIAGMASGPTQYFTADFPAGDYVVMCFVEDANDHKPHFMHGMIQLIKVS
jgi:uncharacterized cupredoxin-like copper-binding protein